MTDVCVGDNKRSYFARLRMGESGGALTWQSRSTGQVGRSLPLGAPPARCTSGVPLLQCTPRPSTASLFLAAKDSLTVQTSSYLKRHGGRSANER